MHRVKSVAALVLFLLFLIFFPHPWSQAVKDSSLKIVRPVLVVSHNLTQFLSTLKKIPDWIRGHEELENLLKRYRRVAIDLTEVESENERLRALLNFKKRISPKTRNTIPAQVIGRVPSDWYQTILIDKGGLDQIRLNMPVMTEGGLLGKVIDVSPEVSKVQLITHPRFRVGGLIQRTRHTGVVYGTLSGESRMKYIPMEIELKKGDRVLTAGLSQIFPKGLLIGRISDVWREPGQVYQVAALDLYADVDRLEEVLCVRNI